MELELRRFEEITAEVVKEMDYLRTREQGLRDTNESTNERVKWFAIGTMGMLVGLGVWQVVYLRAYFRSVKNGWVFVHKTHKKTGRSILFKYAGTFGAHEAFAWSFGLLVRLDKF